MHFLLMALFGITTTQPAILDQTDEEWTAPGYRVVEEVSINPLDYGEPIGWGENCNGPTASVGCQGFFMPTEDGEKWRIIMLLKDKLVILQEDEEIREIPLTCAPRGITFSRNGRYVLANGRYVSIGRDPVTGMIMLSEDGMKRSKEIEYINIDTGEVRLFEPALNSGWIGSYFVNDDGSLFRWAGAWFSAVNALEYYDSDLNLVSSYAGDICFFGDYSHASDGSIFIYRNFRTIHAFNSDCCLLWSIERENTPASSPAVSADGSFAFLAIPNVGLECLDAQTGEILWAERETGSVAPLTSVSGCGWAANFRHRGMLFGTDVESRESINYIRYPAETWSHGRPVAVAVNGTCLSLATSLPPIYRNYNLKKLIYTDEDGSIIWISSAFSIASSPLNVHAPNNNLERDLGTGTSGIQSDGNRFIYSDYEYVMIMRVEGGE